MLQVKSISPGCQLDDVFQVVNGFESRSTIIALHQPRDVLVEHGAPEACGNGVNELIAAQDAGNVVVIENVFRSGQAQGSSSYHYGKLGWGLLLTRVELLGALENVGEHATEFHIAITIDWRRRSGWSGGSGNRFPHFYMRSGNGCGTHGLCHNLVTTSQPRGVEAAQCLIEGRNVTKFRVIGKKRDHLTAIAEHVLGEAL